MINHSREQIIDALLADYLDHLQSLTLEQLIAETDTDDEFTLDDFMYANT